MTYCVALHLKDGIIFGSDTRTNAGIDHIGVYKKLYTFKRPGERAIFIQTAGNLATSQAVLHRLARDIELDNGPHLLKVDNLFEIADMIGSLAKKVASQSQGGPNAEQVDFSSTFTIGGQIKGQEPQLYMVYPEGNYIASSEDTPYFQLGESKYGKPILDRAISFNSDLADGMRAVLVSFDSTIRSNLSVGLPIDMVVYHNDTFAIGNQHRITQEDNYFKYISEQWSEGLKSLLWSFPKPPENYF